MKYEIDKSNSLLKTKAEKFDFKNPQIDPLVLSQGLVEYIIENGGAGIASNQLGLPYNVCAVRGEPFIVMFNPMIVHSSSQHVYMEEGCLSYPNLIIKIKRPISIKVRFTLPNNETRTEFFDGLSARIIQHEIDHLNGIIFKQRATRYHLEKAEKAAKFK